jgi:hypothetical protein
VSDPDDIEAWQRLSDRLTTSGALKETEPARLADYYRSGLEKCRERAVGNPSSRGTPMTGCSTKK